MGRLSLPEIEDWSSGPRWLRDAMTGYLQVVIERTNPYAVAAESLDRLLRETGTRSIVDLGSGAGGPWPALRDALIREGTDVTVTLTDLFPNTRVAQSFESVQGVDYHAKPVSALDVPDDLAGARTMFTSLHHFDPPDVEQILRDAQRAAVPFATFEATHRSARGFLLTLFVPLLVLLLMPRVEPRRFLPLLLTYLPPLLPALIWWDAIASTARTYSTDELHRIVAGIATPEYQWEVREVDVPRSPLPVTQLLGRPVPSAAPLA